MSEIKAGSTDQTIEFLLLDEATGEPAVGLAIADLDASYLRTRSASVSNALTALSAATDAHADNQAIEVEATHHPGVYRVDFPDAAFASGAAFVTLTITGAAIKPASQKFALVGNTAEDVFARIGAAGAGLTALPWNAAWDAEVQSEAADALVAYDPPTNAELEARTLLAADYATAAALSALSVIASAIDAKTTNLPSDPADQSLIIAATNALSALIDAVKAKTDNLPASPAAVGDIPSAASVAAATVGATLAESYAANGAAPTLQQIVFMIWALLANRAIVGTTLTAGGLDGSPAMTFALDSATTPTAQARAS